jgi:catechol 2,3-dioxygenase-like lactoylglutathione lyase family enzyme
MKPVALALFSGVLGWAQLSAPNQTGVAMGHLHYHVRDVAANKKFWVTLGGEPVQLGSTQVIRFPGVLLLLTQGESTAGSEGSVVNHVAFRVQLLAKIESTGLKVDYLKEYPGVASVHTPEGERIELFDDQIATNTGFEFDQPHNDAVADRHNHHITVPIVSHHIHFYVPQGQELQAKAWYARNFGGVPGKRWHYEAVDLPGINLNFSSSPSAVVPTRGRRLDHIGFEITNLEAFCTKLESGGVKFDKPYTKSAAGIATAFVTDPWGTYIELTEGLGGR